jgi:hypothetical protein
MNLVRFSIPRPGPCFCRLAAIAILGLHANPLHADSGYLLLGNTWDQQPNESLCVVNTSTGLASPFTATGDKFLMGIAYDEIGDKLYASTTSSSFFSSRLVEVNRFSGAIDGNFAVGLGNFDTVAEGDVAVQKSTGHVFALRSGGSVHVWNSVTKKFVRSFVLTGNNDFSCIAFNGAGDLYVVDPNSRSADPPHLVRIDPVNGSILQTTVLNTDIGVVAGLAFHPVTDLAWLADACRGDDTCIGSRLYQVNMASGALTLVGSTGLPLAGLTFVPEAPAPGSGQIALFDGAADTDPPLTHNQVTPIQFGTLAHNATSSRPVTIKNTGVDPLTIHRVGALGSYSVSGLPALPAILAAGSTLTFNLAVQTEGGGTYAGSLRVFSSDDDPREVGIPLTAQVPLDKEIRVTGPFGQVSNGQIDPVVFQAGFATSSVASFQVSNDGPDPLTLSSVTIPAGFTVTFSSGSFPVTLPRSITSGSSVNVVISTSGPAAGAYGGVVTLFNNDDDESEFTFPISALHNSPEIQVTANFSAEVQSGGSLDFGTATFGQAVSSNLRITNLSVPTLTITGITLPDGFVFSSVPVFPINLAKNGIRDIGVRLAATAAGNFNGTLIIHNNDHDESAFALDLFGAVREDSIVFQGFSSQIFESPSPQVSAFAFGFNFVPVSYAWDLDGDGEYDDASGQTVTLAGVDGPGSFSARVRVTDSRSSKDFSGQIPIINAAPNISGNLPGSFAAGVQSSFTLTAVDSAPDTAAGFTWVIDWGDGTVETSAAGQPAERGFSHTFSQPGVSRQIVISATDKDGATGQTNLDAWIHSGIVGVFDGADISGTELRDGQDSFTFTSTLGNPQDHEITVLNRGASPATIGPITLPAGFVLVSPPVLPLVIAPSGSATFTIRFLANAFGTFSGVMAIGTSDPLMPLFELNLSGDVEAPDITVNQFSVEAYDFGSGTRRFNVAPGLGSFDGVSLNIDHNGPPLIISAIDLPPGFQIQDLPVFPLVLDENSGSVNLRIQANGPSPSFLKGWVRIHSNDPDDSPFSFLVTSRNGDVQDLMALRSELAGDFDSGASVAGVILHNQAEPLVFTTPGPSERGITLFNLGSQSLSITGATLPAGFSFVSAPSFPITIGSFENQALPAIQFNGTDPGTYAGNLEISSSDPDENPYRIPLLAVVAGAASPELALASIPVITPAGVTTGAAFSADVTGPPGSTVFLEASTDLGKSDPWQVIGQVILNGSGSGSFNAVPDPDTAGNPPAPADFFRLRKD